MLKGILLLCICCGVIQLSAQDKKDSLVTQTIVYKTAKASEVYFEWTMGNWKIPEKKFLPAGSYIHKGMAYSKMNSETDSFWIQLQLPKGIYVDFMFWASKDKKGDSLHAWDNNWGSSYNILIDGKNTQTNSKDDKLYVAEKSKSIKKPFNLLEKGSIILISGSLIALIGWLILFIQKKKSVKYKLSSMHFIGGLLFSALIIILITRLQITGFISHNKYMVLGVGYYDLLVYFFLAVVSMLMLYLSRGKKINIILSAVFGLAIIIVSLFSVINIEIINRLGKPLTYNWLYYSDFLQGTDAKNAIKASFNYSMKKNLLFIALGIIIGAVGFSALCYILFNRVKKAALVLCSVSLIVLSISFIQHKKQNIERGKMENPCTALLFSWLSSGSQSELFTMKVPDSSEYLIKQMHEKEDNQVRTPVDNIDNVIIFIMESTPANMVQIFDSTYKVTPNLNKWKQHARIYQNMYAHLPNTPSTMLSVISGIYPMINYKSIVNEYPAIKTPSLPALLNKNHWNTSLFFSSDLSFSKMDVYLQHQGVQMIEDFKNISCTFKNFSSNYAVLDGLDDRCIVKRYFNWKNSFSKEKVFSILWTNQTHYPYFFSGAEEKYTDNPELNKFLNALEEVDNAFGELMDGLQKQNKLKNTLVFVIGDHGEAFGTHNQYTHGANIYEENIKVPCLLINPNLFKGEKDERIAGVIDVAPTIAHLLGLEHQKEWEGTSLLSSYKRDHAFFIGPYSDFQFGSRFQNWKFIYNAANNQFKLYDLTKDPGELNNVADKNDAVVKNEYILMAAWVQYHNKRIDDFLKK